MSEERVSNQETKKMSCLLKHICQQSEKIKTFVSRRDPRHTPDRNFRDASTGASPDRVFAKS